MRVTDTYVVSLCRNGVLGGMLYLEDTELLYCTNKLTVPAHIRRLSIPYRTISKVSKAPFHTVILSTESAETYRFLVFARESFLRNLAARREKAMGGIS